MPTRNRTHTHGTAYPRGSHASVKGRDYSVFWVLGVLYSSLTAISQLACYSRADCAFRHQMPSKINDRRHQLKAINQPLREERVRKAVPGRARTGVGAVLAPSRERRSKNGCGRTGCSIVDSNALWAVWHAYATHATRA